MEIWHNPRCSKSRAALLLLEESGATFDVRRYLEDAPSGERLDEVLTLLGLEPWEVVRRGEAEFKDLGMAQWPKADRQRWIAAMVEHPKLIERPIVIAGDRAVIGRPTEQVNELL